MNPQMPRMLRTIGFDRDYVSGKGTYVVDTDGEPYLDLLSGFGVFALGRSDPTVHQALRAVMAASPANLVQMECSALSGLLAEALVRRMPNDDYRCFFTNSGAEAVETIIKFARCATGRNRILFADHAFHGLTTGALALNGAQVFRNRFGDLLPGCTSVPFGDLNALSAELKSGDVAALIVEPIQGKGVFVAPDHYLAAASELCHHAGALLAIDEVQTGLGRTGTFFAFEQWNVVPDLVCVAKALSGGYVPVGAAIGTSAILERVFDKLDRAVVHSSTFGQNALAMTAGLATLHVLDRDGLVQNARDRGASIVHQLETLATRFETVSEIRGRGLMIGIEFARPKSFRLRTQWSLVEVMRRGLFTQLVAVPLFREHRILTQVSGDHQNILKILPPLTLTSAEVAVFVTAFEAVLADLEHSLGLISGVSRSLALPALRNGG